MPASRSTTDRLMAGRVTIIKAGKLAFAPSRHLGGTFDLHPGNDPTTRR
jgi:hypothetical protein